MNNRQMAGSPFTNSTTGSRKISSRLIGVMLLLAALVLGSGTFVYYRYITQNQSASQQSLTTMSAAELYQYVSNKPPTLTDSLDGSHADYWNLYMQNGAGCQFKNKALYAIANRTEKGGFCFLRNKFLRNFAFQVQIQFGSISKLNQLQTAGMLFRVHPVQQQAYEFSMGKQSKLGLVKNSASLTILSSSPTQLGSWSDGVPNNMTSPNVLTVIAVQDKLHLYINSQPIATVTDATLQGGLIGIQASDTFTILGLPFEVAFRNMKLWTL